MSLTLPFFRGPWGSVRRSPSTVTREKMTGSLPRGIYFSLSLVRRSISNFPFTELLNVYYSLFETSTDFDFFIFATTRYVREVEVPYVRKVKVRLKQLKHHHLLHFSGFAHRPPPFFFTFPLSALGPRYGWPHRFHRRDQARPHQAHCRGSRLAGGRRGLHGDPGGNFNTQLSFWRPKSFWMFLHCEIKMKKPGPRCPREGGVGQEDRPGALHEAGGGQEDQEKEGSRHRLQGGYRVRWRRSARRPHRKKPIHC